MSYRIFYNSISHQFNVVDEKGMVVWNHPNYNRCLKGASMWLNCSEDDIIDEVME